MDYAVIISAIVLGLSVLATAAKFLDWFLHSDPKTMVRTLRWMLVLLVVAAIPLLVMMIAREQWAGAMLLGAAMLAIPTFLKWRAVLAPLRAALGRLRPRPAPFEMPPVWEPESDDPPLVRQAAAILEAYVARKTSEASRELPFLAGTDEEEREGGVLRVREALEVLGLADGADIAAVHAAHRRLMRVADPDAGGSPYLASRIDAARDVLVLALGRRHGPAVVRAATAKRLSER